MHRRRFLKLGLAASMTAAAPSRALAALDRLLSTDRSLAFYNTHTRENLEATYWAHGNYIPEALDQINHILRDHRSNAINPIDTTLLDLLCALHSKLRASSPFHIISGYRTPATNAALRRHSRGVAKRSLHMYGKAADIRLPGCKLADLRRAAVDLRGGGVGYYPRSDFVHVDVGRVRYW